MRAKMVVARWERERIRAIGAQLGCHMQTVRERLVRVNAEGVDGLGDLPGGGRKRRITERERGRIIALARSGTPGRPGRVDAGQFAARGEARTPPWALDRLSQAAQ